MQVVAFQSQPSHTNFMVPSSTGNIASIIVDVGIQVADKLITNYIKDIENAIQKKAKQITKPATHKAFRNSDRQRWPRFKRNKTRNFKNKRRAKNNYRSAYDYSKFGKYRR